MWSYSTSTCMMNKYSTVTIARPTSGLMIKIRATQHATSNYCIAWQRCNLIKIIAIKKTFKSIKYQPVPVVISPNQSDYKPTARKFDRNSKVIKSYDKCKQCNKQIAKSRQVDQDPWYRARHMVQNSCTHHQSRHDKGTNCRPYVRSTDHVQRNFSRYDHETRGVICDVSNPNLL